MSFKLRTERTIVKLPSQEDKSSIISYFQKNKVHLIDFSPSLSSPKFYTDDFWEKNITDIERKYIEDKEYRLFIFNPEETEVIGTISFTNICRGAFQACDLGYGIDEGCEGKGLMYEALKAVLKEVFMKHSLHRVMANYIPKNKRSRNLLKRLEFKEEGLAKKYLYLNGKWEDHILTSLINEDWKH